MSTPPPPYGPTDPYQQPGAYGQPGYPPMPSSNPTTAPYSSASYPSAPYPPVQSYPSGVNVDPPAYPGTDPGYPYDSKPYGSDTPMNTSVGQPHPPYFPNQPAYPPSGQGYFPGGGTYVPARMVPPSNPYQPTTTEDERRMITSNEGQDGWAGSSFSDKKLRQMFIRKVYLILMAQLLVTVAFIAVFLFCHPVRFWVRRNMWFYGCSYAVFIITYFILICCDSVRRRWPGNIIALSIFTFAMSYMAGTITSVHETEVVLIAVGITAGVCLAVSIFAIQTKIDFTLCHGLIFVLAVVLVLFALICVIVFTVSGPNYILSCVYGGVAALIFSVFLIFDTQMVVGGKHRRYQLSPEEYIYGALQLYVDVVNLFILILGLVGRRN